MSAVQELTAEDYEKAIFHAIGNMQKSGQLVVETETTFQTELDSIVVKIVLLEIVRILGLSETPYIGNARTVTIGELAARLFLFREQRRLPVLP